MKRTLNLSQFKRYIDSHRPSKIIFDTANQPWSYSPLRFHLSFSDIGVYYTPGQIVLANSNGSVCLQCVERVRVDDTDEIFTKVTVTCSTALKDTSDVFRLLLFN